MSGTVRGRQAASVDAAGSAIGSLRLLLFAIIIWEFVSAHPPWAILLGAMAAWLLLSVSLWQIRKHAGILRRKRLIAFRD